MTDAPETDRSRRIRLVVVGLLLAMAAAMAVDVLTDSPRTLRSVHGWIELATIALALGSAALLALGWRDTERSLSGVRDALARRGTERDHWRGLAENALRGLGEAMDRQFDDWSLTPAEKEIALFLLKGYSHKEVAGHTGRSERTVRQHAVSVYRKAGVAGRAELAAFFFEDMLLPGGAPPEGGARPADQPSTL